MEKAPLYKERLFNVQLVTETAPELSWKLPAERVVTVKELGFPVKAPDPLTVGTEKVPAERVIVPWETREPAEKTLKG
jgi:hypothetical protein